MIDRLRLLAVDLGAENSLQLLRAFRRQPLFEKTGVAFVHVPKAAGTSIGSALYGRFVGHFTLGDLQAIQRFRPLTVPTFAVVRNPWDRLASAWRFAGTGGGNAVRVHPKVHDAVRRTETFERFVKGWLTEQVPERLDGIFRPQTCYVVADGGRPQLAHLGRIENMSATIAWLEDTTSRTIAIPRMNVSGGSGYRSMYDSEMRSIVAQKYANDIAAFGYEF